MVVDGLINPRQSDHFMELVPTLVDIPVVGHKDANVGSALKHAEREDRGGLSDGLHVVGGYLLGDIEDLSFRGLYLHFGIVVQLFIQYAVQRYPFSVYCPCAGRIFALFSVGHRQTKSPYLLPGVGTGKNKAMVSTGDRALSSAYMR